MAHSACPPGLCRGVGTNQNAIYVERFMDEAGESASFMDAPPVLPKPKRRVTQISRSPTRWPTPRGPGKPAPQARTAVPAPTHAFNSYVAACAENSVIDGTKIKIERTACATDPGHAVKPAQIERSSKVVRARNRRAVLMEDARSRTAASSRTTPTSSNSIRVHAQMPKVESIVMPSGGFWGGVGEPTICVAAPAVLNAYARATGKRSARSR